MSNIYAPEIVLNIQSQEIVPQRKFKAVWSIDAAQDLRAFQNASAQQELMDILAQEIASEIDREILEDLRRNNEDLQFKNRKKKILPRSIDDDWQVSRFD